MKNMKAKLRKSGGFTLIEMLIVVAIIAILIAVSIPLVGSALEKARDATDMANERAAKAEAAIYYLGVGDKTLNYGTGTEVEMYYDAVSGDLLTATEAKGLKPYGKCTATHTTGDYITNSGDHTKSVIKVTITKGSGSIEIEWAVAPT